MSTTNNTNTFFDNRSKYLSFVHTTNEKVKIAFHLSKYIEKINPTSAFNIFDAGCGEGTVISTFLTALHKKIPNIPITVTAKEISIDDICILLNYLPDRFAEHKSLIFNITNLSYSDFQNLSSVNFKHLIIPITGNTSHDFGLQLMNMSPLIKKHWQIKSSSQKGTITPKHKVLLTLYRQDQEVLLENFIPHKGNFSQQFDFIIASQVFRLRQEKKQVVNRVIRPLLYMLKKKGQMALIYASGKDFSRPMLRYLYPDLCPYEDISPQKLIATIACEDQALMNTMSNKISSFRYGFYNLHLRSMGFSLTNVHSLWNAISYVGQVSEKEQNQIIFDATTVHKFRKKLQTIKNKEFVNYVIHFTKKNEL